MGAITATVCSSLPVGVVGFRLFDDGVWIGGVAASPRRRFVSCRVAGDRGVPGSQRDGYRTAAFATAEAFGPEAAREVLAAEVWYRAAMAEAGLPLDLGYTWEAR